MLSDTADSASSTDFDSSRVSRIQEDVIAWFVEHGRDLPWRRTRDPYRVLVSEVMLQQIQVSRAVPFYLAFIERFPTVQALAAAPVAEVIRVWGDLGRYRRIVYLHRAARTIVEQYDGFVPHEVETLLTLPGVGPYTAGAVACFAFEQDVAFVDTNVRRVVGRLLFGSDGEPRSEREIAAAAATLVPRGRGWAWNQGLLDFGALHCTARKPKCMGCPLAEACAACPVSFSPSARKSRGVGSGQRFEESNRYYRGRVLAALRAERTEETGDGIPLSTLGQQVKPTFSEEDVPWLYGVVSGLQKDGLAAIAEERPTYDASSGMSSDPTVRLP